MKKLKLWLYRRRLGLALKMLPRDVLAVDADVFAAAEGLAVRLDAYVQRSGHMTMAHKSHKRIRREVSMVAGGFFAAKDMVGGGVS